MLFIPQKQIINKCQIQFQNKILYCLFYNFMQIQEHETQFEFTPNKKHFTYDFTTTTDSQFSEGKIVREFNLDSEPASFDQINYLLGKINLEEQENQNSKHKTDRFIPIRKTHQLAEMHFTDASKQNQENFRGKEIKENKMSMEEMYKMVVLNSQSNKLFKFKTDQIKKLSQMKNYGFINPNQIKKKPTNFRKIAKTPFKVLDAPNLQDDFYLNLIDWSKQNVLSVALGSCVYMWDANNNKVSKFCDFAPQATVSSIGWNPKGNQISIGTSQGEVQIWDTCRNKKIHTLQGHTARVSSIAWSCSILASGSRDKTILYRDIRQSPNKIINKITGHTQQVCGLKWSYDEQSLASGGNDNKLYVWNNRSSIPISKFSSHTAAVKAIAWNPNLHGLLASGGGSQDRTIRFWNTLTNTLVDSIDTGSQVCNLLFSTTTNQFVSTHGYSQNQIIIWKYPSLQKISTLTGHSSRVLYLAMNPKGETIVTGAGDQTLRFWNVFPNKAPKRQEAVGDMGMRDLR